MNVEDLALTQICRGDRKRPVDNGKAADIAKSIEHDGLYQAIGVVPCTCDQQPEAHYRLLFGAHRLVAYDMLQRASIPACIWEAGLSTEAYLLIELQENSARNDLTGVQRKAYAAEVGQILLKLAEMSDSATRTEKWFVDFLQKANIPRHTFYDWWRTFCQETGLSLTPRQALDIHKQHFFDWLEAQQRKAAAEKARRGQEERDQQCLKDLEEARSYLRDLIQEYKADLVWRDVICQVFPQADAAAVTEAC